MVRMDALDFVLPAELIATRPAEPRDSSRLLVCSRSDAGMLVDARFRDLPSFLRRGDVMVFNRSGVVAARVRGVRADSGGGVEGLFVSAVAPGRWKVLLRSNGRLRAGVVVALLDAMERRGGVGLRLVERDAEGWIVDVIDDAGGAVVGDAASVLSAVGRTPLPPYILKARKDAAVGAGEDRGEISDEMDRAWYQTVYADAAAVGSVAAPTAGLHFTEGLLDRLGSMGVGRAEVLLHVGEGTFRAVTAERLEEHAMHAEWIGVPRATLRAIDAARAAGGRSVCVGTTTCRALESVGSGSAELVETEMPEGREAGLGGESGGVAGLTRLMIGPGHAFGRVDALITNFHLPRSTLLALVAALFGDDGIERVQALYRHAVAERYRFFSYGDAMLVLP
ncbi:MAG: tRNA preQ1(34) S-adenosylmethionine ribosyltransferase-isomerase QueA [Phycisphaerales bacterium]